jgi:hypothetical protein
MSPRKAAAPPEAVAAMLRAGASYRQITETLGTSRATIAKIRRDHRIPASPRKGIKRTITEALAHHVQPYGNGHARWTGPTANDHAELWAEGRRYNARHQIFAAHHGRDPHGPVRTTCTEPGCIAAPHLADNIIRDADRIYRAIFGPDAP